MESKVCFKCGKEKILDDFYKHPQMGDGHLGKCKECNKKDTKDRLAILLQDETFHENEKARHRDKYYRLGYKDKHKQSPEKKKIAMGRYYDKYPEKRIADSRSGGIDVPKGFEKHHWSYNKEHYKDVLFLTNKDHNLAHRYMIYDQERMMYRTLSGELLDTKERHEQYINQIISNNN